MFIKNNKIQIFIISFIIILIFHVNFAFATDNYSVDGESFSTLVEAYNYIKKNLDGVGKVNVLQDVEDSSYLIIDPRYANRFFYEWIYYNVSSYEQLWNRKPRKTFF